MDKLKKLFVDHQYKVFLVIQITILIVGGFIAYLTVYRFAIFVKAVLGLATIYLFFLEYVVHKRLKNESFGINFEFSKDIRYFVADFIVFVVIVWAGVQVLDLIRYLIRIFIN